MQRHNIIFERKLFPIFILLEFQQHVAVERQYWW